MKDLDGNMRTRSAAERINSDLQNDMKMTMGSVRSITSGRRSAVFRVWDNGRRSISSKD
jgi:hypothetical protein